MEENKKETIVEAVAQKDYYTKDEVNDLLNTKISAIFGDLINQINKPKEEPKEEVKKELTIDELKF